MAVLTGATAQRPIWLVRFGISSDKGGSTALRRILRIHSTGTGACVQFGEQPGQARGVVVTHLPQQDERVSEHERVTLLGFARRLAALRGYALAGPFDPTVRYAGHVYFVPSRTLSTAQASALGIRGVDDLFGGVVPYPFVGTKAISHPLLGPDAAAPAGWCTALAPMLGGAVLAGHAAFDLEDARQAGLKLLAGGPVRFKPVRASGGRGQSVVRDAAQLQDLLARMNPAEIATHGVVLEENLGEMRTFSVGQVRVGGLLASYFGVQRLTRNNEGHEVFGGSDLNVVRGDFERLLAEPMAPEVRQAIAQARRYDAAVHACFPGFYASRKNYDILLGRDGRGRWRSAVLEQSWRVGGATGPELAALEVFTADPRRERVRAACYEVFGASPEPPPHAAVYYRGREPRLGLLTKYTVVEPDDHPR